MIDTPQIIKVPAQRAAVIRLVVPRAEIRNVMGPGKGELMQVVEAQHLTPAGPWYTHHLRMDPDVFDFEIGIPLDAAVTPTGRVQAGELPAATVVRTIYHGDYERLGSAWAEVDAWIKKHAYIALPGLWETYRVGPEENPEPASWRTELNHPIVS